jgi:hypothetical protein
MLDITIIFQGLAEMYTQAACENRRVWANLERLHDGR